MRERFRSGLFWMRVWMAVGVLAALWGIATFIWWMDSVRNLNAMTVVGLWLVVVAGFQSTLGMRKADTEDEY
jgi:hypothetical protein